MDGKPIAEEIRTIILGIRSAKGLFNTLMGGFNLETGSQEGLNPTHLRTLAILDEWGSDSMKRICGRIGLEAGSFTPVADMLWEEGLIDRIPDEKDRRRILLTLTGKGKIFTEKLKEEVEINLVKELSLLDEKLYREFLESLCVLMSVDSLFRYKKS